MRRPAPPIRVPDEDIADLHRRLDATRFPPPWPLRADARWSAGIPYDRLRELVQTWRHGFDWREQERKIAELPAFLAEIDGVTVRFLLFESQDAAGRTPVLLANGWPSSELELVPLARWLAAERTVVVPSIPGFGFAPPMPDLPPRIGTAELFHRLMTEELGFARYAAHGGDLGAGTVSRMAQAHPEALVGIHLMAAADPSEVDVATLEAADERAYLAEEGEWVSTEGGYEHEQRTRPMTLAAGLTDSPVGLLAWLAEKYSAWTDGGRDSMNGIPDEFLLTQVSLYWFSGSIGASFRPYWEHREGMTEPVTRVEVPTAYSDFPADLVHPPASWVSRVYDLRRYTRVPRGGHFAPIEETDLLADDVSEFLRTIDT